jgi:hypothetical protein
VLKRAVMVSLGNTGGSHVYTYVFKKLIGNSSSSNGFLLSMMCVCVCSSVSVRYGGIIRTRAVPVNCFCLVLSWWCVSLILGRRKGGTKCTTSTP